MAKQKIDLIRQALSAAESSIRLARTLLNELERESSSKSSQKQSSKNMPGIIGIYDGVNMVTESGEKYEVPENYASKSILVVGDTLKLVKDGGEKKFKQIEHVKRHKTSGILTKKEGKWAVVTPEGSYRVLSASVDHFSGDVGDEALVQLPAKNLQVPFAAVEKITKKKVSGGKEKEKVAESALALESRETGLQETLPEKKKKQPEKEKKEVKAVEKKKEAPEAKEKSRELSAGEEKTLGQKKQPVSLKEEVAPEKKPIEALQPAEDELS